MYLGFMDTCKLNRIHISNVEVKLAYIKLPQFELRVMTYSRFYLFLDAFARVIKLQILVCGVAVMVACGSSSSSNETTISAKAINEPNSTSSQIINYKNEGVDLLGSLEVLYPNGQLPTGLPALVANQALVQNPAYLSYTVEANQLGNTSQASAAINPQAVTADYQPVKRVQNTTLYGAYFFSIYPSEVTTALAGNPNWRLEGAAFWASLAAGDGLSPVHRFRNLNNGSYLYTIYDAERANIAANFSSTFTYEGVSWYARQTIDTGWSPLYRFRNKTNGTYLFSAYESEKNTIVATYPEIFELEGIAYYVRQDAPVEVQSITLTSSVTGSVPAGVSSSLSATALMSNGTSKSVSTNAAWTSSNEAVATVLWTGDITAKAPGTSTINASYGGKNATFNLTVVSAVITGLGVSVETSGFVPQPSVFAQGDVRNLKMEARYSNGTYVTVSGAWSSSAPSLATVDASGVLRTLAPGTTAIVANYGGFTTVKNVTVATPLTTPLITVTCNAASPMIISAAIWNSAYATDPTNTTKWVVTDWASCGSRAFVKLIYKATAIASSGNVVFGATNASPNSSFYPGRVTTSGSTPQMTSGFFIDVGYSASANDIFYNNLYTLTVQ